MAQWLKKHWLEWVVATVFTLLAALVITWQYTYLCDTNDDVLLRNIVSGAFSGTPDGHTVYIMYPLGWLLKTAYTFAPNVSWYDCFMIGLHYVCWLLLTARVGSLFEKKCYKTIGIVLTYLAIVLIDLPYIVMHQYTVLAALVGVVALFWLVTDASSTIKGFIGNHVITVICLLLCLWIRKQVFIMLLPFVGIALAYLLWKHSKSDIKKTSLRYLCLAGCVALLTVSSFIIENIAYSGEEWQDFLAYNEARTQIYDYYQAPPYDIYKDAYAQEGFNEYDYEVIESHNIALMPEMNTQTLEMLSSWSEEFARWQEQYYSVYRKTLFSLCDAVLYNSVQPIGLLLCGLYVGGFLWAYLKDKKKEALTLCVTGLFQCVFVAYFLWKGRFPERVSYGFYLMQFALLAGMILRNKEVIKDAEPGKKKAYFWKALIAVVILAVAVNFGMYRYKTVLDTNRERTAVATEWESIKAYCAEHGEEQFFMKTNAIGAYCETMFSENIAADNMHYLGTWLLNSPLYEQRLNRVGVEQPGVYFAENENGRILQLGTENTEWLTLYYRERGYEGTVEITDSILLPNGSAMSVLQAVK